jgi:hypothetical protein
MLRWPFDSNAAHVQSNSDIEADEALSRSAPSGLRSLMPVVIRTSSRTVSCPKANPRVLFT